SLGVTLGCVPGDACAPVVSDEYRPLGAERVKESAHIFDQLDHPVGLDRLRCVAVAVAAQVGRDGVIAGVGNRLQLVAPRIPELWKPVQQHHDWPGAGLGNVKSHLPNADRAMGDVRYRLRRGTHSRSSPAIVRLVWMQMTVALGGR